MFWLLPAWQISSFAFSARPGGQSDNPKVRSLTGAAPGDVDRLDQDLDMALLETLTLELGAAVAKSVTKLWLSGSAAEPLAGGVIDILKAQVKDFQVRRATEKLLANIQDEVAQRLVGVIATEFHRLPENDREAAVRAVAEVIERVDIVPVLAATDLDPVKFETTARAAVGSSFDYLGEDGEALARLVLRDTSTFIVTLAAKFPDLHIATQREILGRLSLLQQDFAKMLDMLVLAAAAPANERDRELSSFETHYRRNIVTHLGKMQLFGLDLVGGFTREYDLSVAYVTLSSTVAGQPVQRAVDDCLAGARRVLLVGQAGSGKTTLLQWIALRAALSDFPASLAGWNGRMPFYVRLRDYASRDLPPPERFLESTARNLVGIMPARWAHETLDRRGLMLVDGIDELPVARRAAFLVWIRELASDFPDCIIVASSRHAAVQSLNTVPPLPALVPEIQRVTRRTQLAPVVPAGLADHLREQGFKTVALEPMSLVDSERLVSLWHAAVGRPLTDDEERQRLGHYERDLILTLQDRPSLRALASNPLLCAMICALSWGRRQRLPDDRMELYSIALEVLVDRRDAERAIGQYKLGKKAKEQLLDDLAYWMLINGDSEVDRDRAEARIAYTLPRLHLDGVDARDAIQELLERSGVLREPQHGVVDFIHKTFLEFMGARAAINEDALGVLMDKARSEDWRETIVFAAGHAKGAARHRLISGLLKSPWYTATRRSREARVTVACCLETAGANLDPGLQRKLKETARKLFPPRDFHDSRLLAPAAALEPSWLIGHEAHGAAAVAACIRTAAIVATPAMLAPIRENARQLVPVVQAEVLRAWTSFDFVQYLEGVIRPAQPEMVGHIESFGPDAMIAMQLLVQKFGASRPLSDLVLRLDRDSPAHALDLSGFDGKPTLTKLADASVLARMTSLCSLTVDSLEPGALARLTSLSGLATLSMRADSADMAAEAMALPQLSRIRLIGGITDVRVLEGHRGLKHLDLSSTALEDARLLPQMWLQSLFLPAVSGLGWYAGRARVEELSIIVNRANLGDLEYIVKFKSLRKLKLVAQNADIDVSIPKGLTELHLHKARNIRVRSDSRSFELETVLIEGVETIEDPAWLLSAGNLRELALVDCATALVDKIAGLNMPGVRVKVS